jgi:hypothetical protein
MRHLKNNLILTYIDKELTEIKQEEVKSHLSSCPKCRMKEKILMDKRQTVKDYIDLILPATGSDIPPVVSSSRREDMRPKPFPRRIIFTPVKIPAIAAVFMGIAFLGMFMLLLSKTVGTSAARKINNRETEQLTLICQDGITTFPIDVKLSGFQPIRNPRVLVIERRRER